MRLGVSTGFGISDAEEWVRANQELGLRTVVFPLSSMDEESRIDSFARAAKDADISIAEVGIWRNAIAEDPAEEKTNLEYSITQLALADRIGARCCVNVAGAYAGTRWDGPNRDNFSNDAWRKTVRMIQKVIDEADPKSTYFTIEPMPWMVPTSPREYLNLIEDVARDHFAVHLDVINMINCPERYFYPEEFLDECFSLLKGRIRSCHLKDILLQPEFTFRLKECACGEGTFPLNKYVQLATAEDPDMPMIIEHLADDTAYRESVGYVRAALNI